MQPAALQHDAKGRVPGRLALACLAMAEHRRQLCHALGRPPPASILPAAGGQWAPIYGQSAGRPGRPGSPWVALDIAGKFRSER
ncbi:hypothetical protein M8818_007810 [Zalaria obscura]|uniref:Uncharacterized protein n=1 Tax=Zalaria obscura TaxID=2024903 RepID=A0ACC3S6F2_9PEZI